MVDQMLSAEVYSIVELKKPEKPCVFGLGLSFGGR